MFNIQHISPLLQLGRGWRGVRVLCQRYALIYHQHPWVEAVEEWMRVLSHSSGANVALQIYFSFKEISYNVIAHHPDRLKETIVGLILGLSSSRNHPLCLSKKVVWDDNVFTKKPTVLIKCRYLYFCSL